MPNSLLSPLSFSSWFDGTTGSVVQADVYFYTAGTLDLTPVYEDSNLSTTHDQPIRTTGNGRLPPVFIPEIGSYRIRAYDLDGVLLEDADGLPGAEPDPPTVPDPIATDQTGLLSSGDIIAAFASPTSTRTGFVRCNGRTISNSAGTLSAGTERQNDDVQELFLHLWQVTDANGNHLSVLPSKGASAAADWAAGKAIALPDLRGRTIVGTDTMGATAAGRLTASYFGNTATQPGQVGGSESHTLALTQAPWHDHGWSDPSHTHGNAAHGHTLTDPGHNHSYSPNTALTDSSYGLVTSAQVSGGVGYGGRIPASASSGIPGTGFVSTAVTGITLAVNTITISANFTGITFAAAGGGLPHNNMPPAMALVFYMKIATNP